MVEEVRVSRVTGETTEGAVVTPVVETVYEGRAKLQNQQQYEQLVEVGGKSTVIQRSLIHFPVGSFQMADGDELVFVSSPTPFLQGARYRLSGEAPLKTFETAYRVYADQIVT